jgi:hypothetical protein
VRTWHSTPPQPPSTPQYEFSEMPDGTQS